MNHLFIHSFTQIIQNFDSTTQNLIENKLNILMKPSYAKQWVKMELLLSNHIILLIKNTVLYNENHKLIHINHSKSI